MSIGSLLGGLAMNFLVPGSGILGGISTGQDIEVNVAFKPTSSIPQDRSSICPDARA